jgi:hypothetical protein
VYEVGLKKFGTKNEAFPVASSFLFLGLIGIFTVSLYWCGFLILNATGFEKFQLPHRDQWLQIGKPHKHAIRTHNEPVTTTSIDALFNILLIIALQFTSPFFIATSFVSLFSFAR